MLHYAIIINHSHESPSCMKHPKPVHPRPDVPAILEQIAWHHCCDIDYAFEEILKILGIEESQIETVCEQNRPRVKRAENTRYQWGSVAVLKATFRRYSYEDIIQVKLHD